MDRSVLSSVWGQIKEEELVELALALGNVPAATGYEGPLADYLHDWLTHHEMPSERQEVYPERFNVISRLRGRSGRTALLFNSHLDSDVGAPEDVLAVEEEADYQMAWQEGDRIYGKTVLNDRGPMACFLLAGLAIKRAGIQLEHDLILSATVGEIGMAPIDEYQGSRYIGKGIGARHMVTHGVLADFAFVGETTDYCPVWAECGVLYYKITVYGESIYAPRVQRPTDRRLHPNAVVRAKYIIDALEDWAERYQAEQQTSYAGGTIVPKVNIGAIRGGTPHKPHSTSGLCSLYVDVLIPPGSDPQLPGVEIRRIIDELGYECDVECYLSRMGYVAENIEPLLEALREAHRDVFGQQPGTAPIDVNSMWRDINVFNEVGIPSLNYGPPRRQDPGAKFANKYFLTSDLVHTARVYAGVMLRMCGVSK